ncbi:MAG: transposase [Chloroflexota bacterium]
MMKRKRLAQLADRVVSVKYPISNSERKARQRDYKVLSPKRFADKYRPLMLFRPVKIRYRGKDYLIQVNFCAEVFCRWFGIPQGIISDPTAKGKPTGRYRLSGTERELFYVEDYGDPDVDQRHRKHKDTSGFKQLVCNDDGLDGPPVLTKFTTRPYSNWALAEEIQRLATHDAVVPEEQEYRFHDDGCVHQGLTPFDRPDLFLKRGKSRLGLQRWQCRGCQKLTNELPNQTEQSYNYNQKRNDILPLLADLVVNRVPVARACEILGISPSTYYLKLRWLHRRCLEFLERHEARGLRLLNLDELWLDVDELQYNLNNLRQKGKGGFAYDDTEVQQFETHIVAFADMNTRYVFRADVAYDTDIDLNDIKWTTKKYGEDHLDIFCRRFGRFRRRFSYHPRSPGLCQTDDESPAEYKIKLQQYERRKRYVPGVHVNYAYTAMAGLWLLQHAFGSVRSWRFITDDDKATQSAIKRIFVNEIKAKAAHIFICNSKRERPVKQSFAAWRKGRRRLRRWAESAHLSGNLQNLAVLCLAKSIQKRPLYIDITNGNQDYPVYNGETKRHPLHSRDEGSRNVACITDISNLSPLDQARILIRVNNHATNSFFQEIRRRLNILERPLVTARGTNKSYIYANFNPLYAIYAVSILRVYYNYCLAFTTGRGQIKLTATPAQRLGLVKRQYAWKDIIYLK